MNKHTISDISSPIKEELTGFNEHFKAAMKSNVPLLDLVLKYILRQKGKKIRPLLVLLCSKAVNEVGERTFRGATLVEILHTATLVHDDVVDDAEKRRGLPSINYIWKRKVAVLLGDYLLAKGLMLAVDKDDFDFLKIITGTVKRMSEGELLQISKTRKLDIDEETYFKVISDKTASLIATCCEIGAAAADADTEVKEKMKDFGENLGIAFQIRDDILDYIGKKGITGKPLGGDIKEKKITLPLIYSLKQADKKEEKTILNILKKNPKGKEIEQVIQFVLDKKGIEYAETVAEEYGQKARKSLEILKNSESKDSLINLIEFVLERKN